MVKETSRVLRGLSNSDRKIQRLYQEAINEIRESNTAAVLLEQASKEAAQLKQTNQPNKSAKRVKPVHKSPHQAERPSRGCLNIPVSKLLPFRYDPRGYHFPIDFRKDETNNWIPRATETDSIDSETTESESYEEFSQYQTRGSLDSRGEEGFGMDGLLQVLPLRADDNESDDGSLSSARSSNSSSANRSLPPLYRREIWHEIMARASTNCNSIPAKTRADGEQLLVVGNEENFSKEWRKQRRIGLVERRTRLRATAARIPRHTEG